jgi:hypothetical protein
MGKKKSAMKTIPQVSAQQAQAAANQFLSNYLSDRFTADQAHLRKTGDSWQVPVILAYPIIGSVGQVGEIWVSTATEQVVFHTPVDEMRQAATRLYKAHCHEIEAAFL